MSRRSCWRTLGIARTADIATIRRAYAARLKGIDLDRDADGFQALRDARDEAMYLASLQPDVAAAYDVDDRPDGEAEDDGVVWGLGDIAAELDAEPEPIATEPDPEHGGLAEQDAPYHALYDLLDPDTPDRERYFPDDADAAAIRAAYDAIVADPRMDEIGFYDHQESWLATVIALSWPTSEPLIEPAVAHFGWAARAGEIGQDPDADFAVQRAAAAGFERAVQSPNHPNHAAWRELTTPADEHSRRRWFMRSQPINALLRKIRTEYPTLEGYLDPWRVALWERPGAVPTSKRQLAITLGVIVLINVLIRMPWRDDPVSPPNAPPLTLAEAVRGSSVGRQVSLDDIAADNPALRTRLDAELAQARARGLGQAGTVTEINRLLNDHVGDVLRDPPYPVLQLQARLLVAQAKSLQQSGWERCVTVFFGGGGPAPTMPDKLNGDVADLRARAVLSSPIATKRVETEIRGRIEPDVARRISERVGLSGQTFRDALMNQGAAKDRCETRIAAIEVALDLPQAQGEALLRMLAS